VLPLSPQRRVLLARTLAVVVDLAQWALLPAALTPLNNGIDVATGLLMIALVGWHWAFLPTFFAELVPFVDLVPTWTLAVMIATRDAGVTGASAAPPTLPPAGKDSSGEARPAADETARPR
jgi:hypothetical protein